MAQMSPLELEVIQHIIQTLNLTVVPSEVDPMESLFGAGLGLDSIDALELALAVSQRYGYKIRSNDPDNERIFSSLHSLCEAIAKNRTK